jgi:hypothetical protein
MAKSKSIELALAKKEDLYSIENFVFVINTGLGISIENHHSLESIRKHLALAYNVT